MSSYPWVGMPRRRRCTDGRFAVFVDRGDDDDAVRGVDASGEHSVRDMRCEPADSARSQRVRV